MKRPFEPAVDVHIGFLRQYCEPVIAESASAMLVDAHEVLLEAKRDLQATTKGQTKQDLTAALQAVSEGAELRFHGILRQANEHLANFQQRTSLPRVAQLNAAHGAIAYVVRDLQSQLHAAVRAVHAP